VEADDNAAASVYYAAECFIHGCVEFALWAAERAIDEVSETIQRDENPVCVTRPAAPAGSGLRPQRGPGRASAAGWPRPFA
jgi:hypothetical protein